MQQIVGQFRSIQVVYPYIIPFLRRLEEVTSLQDNKEYAIITTEQFEDALVIEHAISDIAARPMSFGHLLYDKAAADVTIYTDAATGGKKPDAGVGGFIYEENVDFFRKLWKHTKSWNTTQFPIKPDIVFLELLGVVTTASLWGHRWTGKAVLFRCDNWADCIIVSKKCACFRRPDLNALLRILCKTAIKHRFWFWIKHVRGIDNGTADKLSRFMELDPEDIDIQLNPKETPCDDEINRLLSCYYSNYHRLHGNTTSTCNGCSELFTAKQSYQIHSAQDICFTPKEFTESELNKFDFYEHEI